jgi:hypothetical protein
MNICKQRKKLGSTSGGVHVLGDQQSEPDEEKWQEYLAGEAALVVAFDNEALLKKSVELRHDDVIGMPRTLKLKLALINRECHPLIV